MKFSIITPTHNPKYLKELEKTILEQTFSDWEWIILLNNGAEYKAKDKRIKIFTSTQETNFVGSLKKEACSISKGEILVEADHDDLLTPDCLQELAKAYEDKEIGFVYSDNAKLADDFKPYQGNDWTYRMFKYGDRELFAMNSQPTNPGRLGYIWFAPDHVRSWRKSIYDQIGGHKEMKVLDDQDLMHRLYMVTKFCHIPKVLYIYRIVDNKTNTWLVNNAQIQKETVEIYAKNVYNLSERFCQLNSLAKIDLCGGFNKPEGYVSIDKYNGDIFHDLEKGIPLADNSVGIIRAHDALEHISNQQMIMKEIHRVLAPGGMLLSQTPSTDGRGAWQDPTHISFWNQNSFYYWTRPEYAKYIQNDKLFRECRLITVFPNEYCKNNNIPYVIAHLEKL